MQVSNHTVQIPQFDLLSAFCNCCTAELRLGEEEVGLGANELEKKNLLVEGESRVTNELINLLLLISRSNPQTGERA